MPAGSLRSPSMAGSRWAQAWQGSRASGWEGARQKLVKHCLRLPGLRGEVAGGTLMCAKGSRSRAGPSAPAPFGATGRLMVLLLRAVMKYEGLAYPIKAN